MARLANKCAILKGAQKLFIRKKIYDKIFVMYERVYNLFHAKSHGIYYD